MKRREFIKTVAPISLLPFALNGQPVQAYGKLLGMDAEDLFGNKKTTSPKKNSFRCYQKDQWNERYQELLLFRKEYGHLFVPHSYEPNQKLAQWVKVSKEQVVLICIYVSISISFKTIF